jgi:hypothetical protein
MTAATLWIEMTIAGSVYVASLFFFVMAIWHPNLNLECLANRAHDFLTYVAVGFVALSYIFGFVAHRVIQVAGYGLKLVAKRRPKKELKEELTTKLMEEMTIWALCSQRVHREMDFQFTQRALLRSLALSTPLLAVSFGYWRYPALPGHLLAGIACFVVLYGSLILALIRQSRQYETIREQALFVARKLPDYWAPVLSPQRGKEGSKVTIRGINFGSAKEKCTVTFAATPTPFTAKFDTWEPTQVIVLVPRGLLPGSETEKSVVVTVAVDLSDARMGTDKYELTISPPFTVLK